MIGSLPHQVCSSTRYRQVCFDPYIKVMKRIKLELVVAWVLHGCCKGVARVLQGCCKGYCEDFKMSEHARFGTRTLGMGTPEIFRNKTLLLLLT